MVDRKFLAIIPARAGSKGLPGKNYKEIKGKPLIEWSILAAKNSEYITHIVVSSNDEKIKQICNKYQHDKNFYFIERKENISKDDSSTESAMLDAIFELKSEYDLHFCKYDFVCLLQPTSPSRRNNLIDRSIESLLHSNKKSLITVSKHTPFFWRYQNKDCAYPIYSLQGRPPRQKLSEYDFYYHDNGNLYINNYEHFINNKIRIDNNPYLFETDFFDSLQIDSQEDYNIMSSLYDIYGGFL